MNFPKVHPGKGIASTPGSDLRNVCGAHFCIIRSGKMPPPLYRNLGSKDLSKYKNKG